MPNSANTFVSSLLDLDTRALYAVNHSGNEWLDPLALFLSGTLEQIPFYVLMLWLLWKNLEPKAFGIMLLAIGLCAVATDQLSVHAFKEVFKRLRPCHVEALSLRLPDGCGGQYGFVSSHAANTFGIAGLMFWWNTGIRNQKAPGLYSLRWVLIWAGLVSLSRVYLGVHYPGDVLGGALLGLGMGWLLAKAGKASYSYLNPSR